MSNSVNNFFNNVFNTAKTFGDLIIGMDRSYEGYGLPNDDSNKILESHLKGRARQMTLHLTAAIPCLALGILMMAGHNPGIVGYLSGGTFALAGLVHLKELALQNIARNCEKRINGIAIETNETSYSLEEALEEAKDYFNHQFRPIKQKLFGTRDIE